MQRGVPQLQTVGHADRTLVDLLVAEGGVDRAGALTGEGEALLARIFPHHAAAIARAVAGLDEAQRGEAIDLLRTLGQTAAALEGTDAPEA